MLDRALGLYKARTKARILNLIRISENELERMKDIETAMGKRSSGRDETESIIAALKRALKRADEINTLPVTVADQDKVPKEIIEVSSL